MRFSSSRGRAVPDVTGDPNRFAQNCSPPSPRGTTGWPRSFPWDRTADGGGPWSTTSCLPAARGSRRGVRNGGRRSRARDAEWADVVGVDLTIGMLRQGGKNVRGRKARAGATGRRPGRTAAVSRHVRRADLHLPVALCGRSQATLCELARVVKPGGAVASLEFFVPPNAFWRFWCSTRGSSFRQGVG